MSNRAELELTLGSRAPRQRKPADEPFRILMLADFTAREDEGLDLKPRRISFETLDATIAAMTPTAKIIEAVADKWTFLFHALGVEVPDLK